MKKCLNTELIRMFEAVVKLSVGLSAIVTRVKPAYVLKLTPASFAKFIGQAATYLKPGLVTACNVATCGGYFVE